MLMEGVLNAELKGVPRHKQVVSHTLRKCVPLVANPLVWLASLISENTADYLVAKVVDGTTSNAEAAGCEVELCVLGRSTKRPIL